MRRFIFGEAPAIAYVIVVFVLGSVRELPAPVTHVWDKFQHFAAFGVMQVIVARALSGRTTMSFAWQQVLAVTITSALGALLEVYQMALPWRSAEVGDWVADTIGAALAALGCWTWWQLRKRVLAAADNT